MNTKEELRLIRYTLKWIIEREHFDKELRKEMDLNICNALIEEIKGENKE